MIPVIRKYAENALIIVGTPNYSSNLNGALLNPLPYDNVMYAYEGGGSIDTVTLDGTSGSTLSLESPTNCAQLWTMLARQADTDTTGGTTWYEKTQIWAKKTDISDGSNPNGNISRAEMVTMLWRTMGQPAATDKVSFVDVPAGSYYAQAVAWAVESGITQGVGGGRFDPAATCTRAQIAAFLTRLYAEK